MKNKLKDKIGRLNIQLRPEIDSKLRVLADKTKRKLTAIIEMGIERIWEEENE